VMDELLGRVFLRPPGGGVEWTALPGELDTADERDRLRARVGEWNAASSGGVL
jgi:hypothetical protein